MCETCNYCDCALKPDCSESCECGINLYQHAVITSCSSGLFGVSEISEKKNTQYDRFEVVGNIMKC